MVCLLVLIATTVYAGSTSFQHPSGQFRLVYDSDIWEIAPIERGTQRVEEVDQRIQQAIQVSLQRKVANDRYHPRFSVVVEDATRFDTKTPSGAENYRRYALDFLKSQRFQVLSQRSVTLGELPAYEITAYQRDFGLTYVQWIVLEGTRAFLLTGAARTQVFEERRAELDAMARSLQLKVEPK